MLKTLKDSNVPAMKVTDFIRRDDYIMYLVHFGKSINLNILNHSHRTIDGIIVKWEIVKKTNKKVTQCFRCQNWGHSSINCGLPFRCVKCSESHEKGACQRTSREGDPKCCNCGGPHSSNHRGCPSYKQHIEKKARSRKPLPVPIRANHVIMTSSNFPSLVKESVQFSSQVSNGTNVSFAKKVKESSSSTISSNNHMFSRLTQAQQKLSSIPDINETIENFITLVDELSACDNQQARLMILIKHCTNISLPSNGP